MFEENEHTKYIKKLTSSPYHCRLPGKATKCCHTVHEGDSCAIGKWTSFRGKGDTEGKYKAVLIVFDLLFLPLSGNYLCVIFACYVVIAVVFYRIALHNLLRFLPCKKLMDFLQFFIFRWFLIERLVSSDQISAVLWSQWLRGSVSFIEHWCANISCQFTVISANLCTKSRSNRGLLSCNMSSKLNVLQPLFQYWRCFWGLEDPEIVERVSTSSISN